MWSELPLHDYHAKAELLGPFEFTLQLIFTFGCASSQTRSWTCCIPPYCTPMYPDHTLRPMQLEVLHKEKKHSEQQLGQLKQVLAKEREQLRKGVAWDATPPGHPPTPGAAHSSCLLRQPSSASHPLSMPHL